MSNAKKKKKCSTSVTCKAQRYIHTYRSKGANSFCVAEKWMRLKPKMRKKCKEAVKRNN